jgi:hypothetical protein
MGHMAALNITALRTIKIRILHIDHYMLVLDVACSYVGRRRGRRSRCTCGAQKLRVCWGGVGRRRCRVALGCVCACVLSWSLFGCLASSENTFRC